MRNGKQAPAGPRGSGPGVLEGLLWLIAAVCLCFLLAGVRAARAARLQSNRISPVQEIEVPGQQAPGPAPAHAGQVIGRLEIAALHLSVPIVEGDDVASLRSGAGHIPGTAVPGGLGNLGLAAHRDTFFRPLRGIRPGMSATVIDAAGRWTYIIEQTEVVDPDRIDLLGIGDVPEMTLVTCYPFNFIGAAPQRFIVHARLLSAAGGS